METRQKPGLPSEQQEVSYQLDTKGRTSASVTNIKRSLLKFTLEKATKDQGVSRGIALLFLQPRR